MAPHTVGLILTSNGERLLGSCLASLSFCDQLIVVDSESSEVTVDIAKAAGSQVLTRRWEGPGPQFCFALEHIRAVFINAVHGAFYAFLKHVRTAEEGDWGPKP
jgi:hypothetical protein